MASGSMVSIAMDALARSNATTSNFGAQSGMKIQTGPPSGIGHIHAALTPQLGTVSESKLRTYQSGLASSGSRVLSLYRITAPWREDKLTWANKPARAASATATVSLSGAGTEGRLIEWDVTADVQKFVDGTWPNYGWTIECSNANFVGIFTKESAKLPPQLAVSWSATPAPPTDLTPSGTAVIAAAKPTLRWSFIDRAGDVTLSAVQVHIKSANSGWTPAGGYASPTFDSGEVATSQPDTTVVVDFPLGSTAYSGISSGSTVWWTARHRDGAGLWSTYSDPQSMTYQPHQAVTMTAPATSTVNDTTFPVVWTATAQSRYEVLLRDATGSVVWRSGVVTSTSLRQHQIPRGVIPAAGVAYQVAVRVWDGYARQPIVGALDYVEATRTVTYADTTDVAPVTNLAVAQVPGLPNVELTWSRSAAPAMFSIWVDGAEHIVEEPSAFGTGPGYAFPIVGLAAGRPHDFTVKAITSSTAGGVTTTKASANNPTENDASIDPIGVWLIDTADPDRVVLLTEENPGIIQTDMPEGVTSFEPLGSSTKVHVTTALRAVEGTCTDGVLADFGPLLAEEMRTILLSMKGNRTTPVRLVSGRLALDIWILDVNVTEDPIPTAVRYKVGFRFAATTASSEYRLT